MFLGGILLSIVGVAAIVGGFSLHAVSHSASAKSRRKQIRDAGSQFILLGLALLSVGVILITSSAASGVR